MFQYVTVFALFVCGINSQIIRQGKCPDVPAQQNFNLMSFGGYWYEAERSPVRFEDGSVCNLHDFVRLSKVEYADYIHLRRNGDILMASGIATFSGKPDEAKFTFNITLDTDNVPRQFPLFILETDYGSYASLWSCSQIDPNTYEEFSIILTHSRYYHEDTLNKARNVYDRNNISRKEFEKVEQFNC
ncbi:hypothetical protein WA026_005530 [Henosepilachna vigintioctopunctata]|uniref:Uncharacterized protein n=1 Tax=Henosepilachna vigintioctopunctata TaxID=420089 RepID=A0AAW1U486_9CUCU